VDEGSVELAIDQVEVNLVFSNVDPSGPYVFTILYVENQTAANPIGTFDPIPGARLSNGRKIILGAAPDTANYVLRWRAQS
jgi:hypothetical protein